MALSLAMVLVLASGGAEAEPGPLVKLPVGAVRARGWLATQVELLADGMFGNLPRHSRWCRPEGSAWRSRDGRGERGWEELPYWLKGLTSLAFVLADRDGDDHAAASRSIATSWLEAILASQREDGFFGPESNRAQPDLWPNMPVLWAMRTWHEATGDPRILEFLAKYFRWQLELPRERLLPDSWQKVRGGDNLEIVLWLHERTGEPWLLDLARRLHERTADWTSGIASWHGVNFCQGFREPLQFFALSGDPRHRDATVRNYDEMMLRFGQVPGGMFGADENCRPGHSDPRQAAESCSMVELMASCELLGARTGEAIWFERCEEIAFNSLPAAMDAELRSLHYLTAPNLVACDASDHHPGFDNGGCMLAYSPDERYRCCQHDVIQGWPYFVEHLWLATREGGLAAAMLAPCEVRARVAGDVDVRIETITDYPFDPPGVAGSEPANGARVTIVVHPSRPAEFPIHVRIPSWCEGMSVRVAGRTIAMSAPRGSFARIERTWQDGNRIELSLPMAIRVRRFEANHGSVAIDRGPLTYSLRIDESWQPLDPPQGPLDRQVLPASPWNYGLLLDAEAPERSITVIPGSTIGVAAAGRRPFGWPAPITLRARGRRIPAWQVDHTGLVAKLQPGPVRSEEADEELELVPMGCARLRISAFPVIGEGPDAHDWKPPPRAASASHRHDDVLALNDGVLPAGSIDHSVPRFTFWDHLGTVEWVQYDFEAPRRIARSSVYWFDDTGRGRCRVPKSWRLLWLDESGAWREVEGASGYAVAKDRLIEVRFAPVVTKAVRLEATLQPEFSGGMFEWSVGERAP